MSLKTQVKLSELIEDHNSGVYIKKIDYGQGIPIVGVGDLFKIDSVANQTFPLAPLTPEQIEKFSLEEGNILYAESSLVRAGIAKSVYVQSLETTTAFAWHTRRLRVDKKKVNPAWLYFYLESPTARKQIQAVATQTVLTGITTKDYFETVVYLPPLAEQKKVASFLSAVDKKMATLEAQLKGWKEFKRGMMQRLFSQRLRFKSDDGSEFPDWVDIKLKNKFSFHKTNNLSRAVLGLESDGVRNIHYGDIHTKYRAQFDIRNEITGIIPSHLVDKAGEPLRKGDVIFADASEDYNDVGKAIEVINLDGRPVVAGLHTIVARPHINSIALGFAAYLFASWPLRKQLMRIANGASVLGISKTNLAKVDLTLPSLPEQQKIADALLAIDTKIEALTDRLDATREFKRGLLQKMFV